MGKILEAIRSKSGGALSAEHVNFVSAIEEAMSAYLSEEYESRGKNNSEAIEKALTEVIGVIPKGEDGQRETLISQLRMMGEKMDKIESNSRRKLNAEEKFNLRAMVEREYEAIKKAVNSDSPLEVRMAFNALRAPSIMMTTNVVTGVDVSTALGAVMDPDIVRLRYPQNWILDMITNRQVQRVPPARIMREQASREGQAVVVAEGNTKPLVSYTFEDKVHKRQKIAAHMEWTEEFEMDFESLFNAILDMFETDLLRDWQDILLDMIIAAASPYVSTSLDGTIPVPNIYSAIGAGVLSIQNTEKTPDVIWMNPGDVWAMNLTQDTSGQYVIPPFMIGSNQIAGMRLYVSTKIDPGHALIGDSTTWREEHTDFISRIGLINDQLIRNEKTIVGEVFSLARQAVADQGSWIYLDFAAVMAALQKA